MSRKPESTQGRGDGGWEIFDLGAPIEAIHSTFARLGLNGFQQTVRGILKWGGPEGET